MRLAPVLIVSSSTVFGLAGASENPFIVPSGGYNFTVEQPTNLAWTPTTPGTVSLYLEWTLNGTVSHTRTIVDHTSNNGSYTWTPPSSWDLYEVAYIIALSPDNMTMFDSSAISKTPSFVIAGTRPYDLSTDSNSGNTKLGGATNHHILLIVVIIVLGLLVVIPLTWFIVARIRKMLRGTTQTTNAQVPKNAPALVEHFAMDTPGLPPSTQHGGDTNYIPRRQPDDDEIRYA